MQEKQFYQYTIQELEQIFNDFDQYDLQRLESILKTYNYL